MALVVESSVSSQTAADATNHTVSLPTGIVAGELLVCVFASDGGNFGAENVTTLTFPAGWAQSKRLVESGQGACLLEVWWKKATGSEDASMTVTTSVAEETAHAVYRISGADTTQSPEASTGVEGISLSADPDALTPSGGSQEYVWIACAGGDVVGTAASAPTNYVNFETEGTGGVPSCGLAAATRVLTASSEDPGAFGDWQASDEWVAFTVAVQPKTVVSLFATGTQTIADVVNENDNTTDLHLSVDDDPASPDDLDWVNNDIALGAASVFFDITDVPTDFGNAEAATITVRAQGQDVSSTTKLYAQIFESDETTALSDEVEAVNISSDGTWTNYTVNLTGINTTADKSVWDAARVRFRWSTT